MKASRMYALGAVTLTTLLAISTPVFSQSDWPSYNRTLTSERFAPLSDINTGNTTTLKVLCSYDTGEMTAFQSGLIQVDGALFATTEHDTISLDPNTCKENWRVHEDFTDSYLGAQRGVAIEGGLVFRGAANGNIYAYDEKTGHFVWNTEIANPLAGETVPASPIVWKGLVFIGIAGGDNKGVKGRMYALDAATGNIVWEFYLVPKGPADKARGPQAPSAIETMRSSWGVPAGFDITGGATWTSYSLDPKTGLLYIPSGNPAPDFVNGMRKGDNLFSGSIVVLDAKTGAYKRHFQLSANDFHDWDASSAPALFQTKNGRYLLATAPKDGHLYGYDLSSGKRLYRIPLTTVTNVNLPLSSSGTRFCPGTQGGAEWNGPAYDPSHDAVITGQVDWCTTVHIDPDSKVESVSAAQPWTGSSKDGFGQQDDPSKWAGWVVSTDALSGSIRWKFKAPFPVLAAVTPTAGNIVLFGDMGGNLYVLNSETGAKLWSQNLGGAISGGLITYDTGVGQRVAVTTGMTSKIWPTAKVTGRIYVLSTKSE